jgi:hypothetical protein
MKKVPFSVVMHDLNEAKRIGNLEVAQDIGYAREWGPQLHKTGKPGQATRVTKLPMISVVMHDYSEADRIGDLEVAQDIGYARGPSPEVQDDDVLEAPEPPVSPESIGLRLVPSQAVDHDDNPDWVLDDRTRQVGRMGIAASREVLNNSTPPQPRSEYRDGTQAIRETLERLRDNDQ